LARRLRVVAEDGDLQGVRAVDLEIQPKPRVEILILKRNDAPSTTVGQQQDVEELVLVGPHINGIKRAGSRHARPP
jgi:hypothetical protein